MQYRRTLARHVFAMLFLALSVISYGKTQSFEQLKTGFITPAEENNLWCYWYWINDDISKEGITKDLQAMKKAGIGGALIGNINPAKKDGKVPMLSEEWWSHMVHAVVEGKRLGVDIGVFNCPGWSQSGGPWVDYTKAMRYLTFSETKVNGGEVLKVQLKQPKEEFQDTYTLAFKTPSSNAKDLKSAGATLSSPQDGLDLAALIDGNLTNNCAIPAQENTLLNVSISLEEPIIARQLTMTPSVAMSAKCQLFAVIDGGEKLIKTFDYDRRKLTVNVGPITHGELAVALPEVEAKTFRLVCRIDRNHPRKYGLAELNISEKPVLEKYIEKQLGKMHPTPTPLWDTYIFSMQEVVKGEDLILPVEGVLDISDKLDENGLLTWDAPEGEWTILRMGMTPTGTENAPAAPQGTGYEIDKMNGDLVKYHFDNFVGELLRRIPEDSKSAFKYVIADSYEMGSQNWTDGYEKKFQAKYGYDPVKYLPVLSGVIVGSVEESERFLWDLRRSIADDVAYEYVGALKEASNKHHLKTWLENYGHWGFPSEFMMYGGQSDLIAGEFWNEGTLGNIECKASSSTSHTYGKPLTSAECFTSARKTYLRHPAMLKTRGDWSLTEGINHFVLHLYIQQPDDQRKPGMNAWFGTEFNRHNTWFGQADTYFDYLRRCQFMLQQGKYAADVCYFIGENTPIMTGGRVPEIPKGYSYDYINAEVIMQRLSVKDGRFVLPDGMSYKVMVLPPFDTMRPELLAKIEQLVAQGGIVLGPQPQKSPSLQNYPNCDAQVKELASKLWSGTYTDGKMTHNYGKGQVLDGYSLEEVFASISLPKDVDVPAEANVLWTHRTMPDKEIYFISNQNKDKAIELTPEFRVSSDMKPQLWDAVTGEMRALGQFEATATGIKVPLKMAAAQSWFVVFTKEANEQVAPAYTQNFPTFANVMTVNTPFTVDFKNKDIAPQEPVVMETLMDWSKSDNEQIKYYSGTAVYTTAFKLKKCPKNKSLFLNLGEVSVMAKVKLNGEYVGGVWIAPYRLDVSDYIKKGKNQLEIEVVNLWRNQLLRDRDRPEGEKYTWLVEQDLKPKEEVHSSGLLGPVVIEVAE